MMRVPITIVDSLFREECVALSRFVSRKVGREEADDVVQEAFLKLMERKDESEVVNASSFLKRVAANVAIDCLRKRRTRRTCIVDGVDLSEVQARFGNQGSAELAMETHRVRNTLSKMPQRSRHIYLLSRLYGLSYPEIAHRVGVSVRTVNRSMGQVANALDATLGSDSTPSETGGDEAEAKAGKRDACRSGANMTSKRHVERRRQHRAVAEP